MNIDTIYRFFHQPTLHPMVAVGELSRADLSLFEDLDFGMYCVILLGDRLYTLRPGQQASLKLDYADRPRGWMLAFHPSLLVKAGLGRDFYMFDFFDREFDEAPDLTLQERGILAACY